MEKLEKSIEEFNKEHSQILKTRLLSLIYGMPDDADETFEYLFHFIGCGMVRGMFAINKDYIETFVNYEQEKKTKEQSNEKKEVSESDKKKVNMARMIMDFEREDVINYLWTILSDINSELKE